MSTLDTIRNWTPDKDQGRSDFDDLPTPTYKRRVPASSVRIVDATAAERSAAAKHAAALRGPVNTNTDYANPKPLRPLADDEGKPSDAQTALMLKLMGELLPLDAAAFAAGEAYMAKMHGHWTRGREGNASKWISRLITKIGEAKDAAASKPATVAPTYDTYDDVTDGNYAYERDGKTHFYRISRKQGRGQYAGRTFLNIQERASEELFSVRGPWAGRKTILEAIRAAGVERSHLMYSERLGRCWHCNILLTDDTTNTYRPYGLGPVCGPKVMG